jgi:protein-L-isoaspartate(D-aspartate) O-methyltransferase
MNYQEELLNYARSKYPLSTEVIAAYRSCPRHKFIHHSYSMEEMYADYPLEIYRDEEFISTISQPSFVMLMIDVLDLRPGQKVLELGAGSGWNAALMSKIVAPTGKVVSIEIIPSLADETRENLKQMGFTNIKIITGDAAKGDPTGAPFDRAIFTAGATDLPRAFHEQIKVGGKLLFVLKTHSVDLLLNLVKREDHFEEISRLHCSFVPMKGDRKVWITPEIDSLVLSDERIEIYPSNLKGGSDSVFSLN